MKELQEFAKYYIAYSDLSEADCSKLMKFVDEASDKQIDHLLQTGYMVSENEVPLNEMGLASAFMKVASVHLDIIEKAGFGTWLRELPNIISKAYKMGNVAKDLGAPTTGLKTASLAAAPPALAAGALATLIIWLSFKVYKKYLRTKGSEVCDKYKGDQKKQCLAKVNAHARKMRAADLQKAMALCGKTKNPGKCKQKLARKISAIKSGSNE